MRSRVERPESRSNSNAFPDLSEMDTESQFRYLDKRGYFLSPTLQFTASIARPREKALPFYNRLGTNFTVKQIERARCTTSCTIASGGGYECGDAKVSNPQLDSEGMAPVELQLRAVENNLKGIRLAYRLHKSAIADVYQQSLGFSPELAVMAANTEATGTINVNAFGEPLDYYRPLDLLRELSEMDINLVVSTAANKFLDPKFFKKFTSFFRGTVAFSMDDISALESVDYVRSLVGVDGETIRREMSKLVQSEDYKRSHVVNGQKLKALSALYAVGLFSRESDAKVLLNIVYHPKNARMIWDIEALVLDKMPGTIMNFYPAQSAMYEQRSPDGEPIETLIFNQEEVEIFGEFNRHIIDRQLNADSNYSARMPSHLYLDSLRRVHGNDWRGISRVLSGYSWQCYRDNLPLNCVEYGKSGTTAREFDYPGGHPNCFWNPSITDMNLQSWDASPEQLAEHMTTGKRRIALSAGEHVCPGCNMTRKQASAQNLIRGLDDIYQEAYRETQTGYLGI